MSGLGASHMFEMYGIRDRQEAVAYLRHPTLNARLRAVTAAVAEHVAHDMRVDTLMSGSTDAQKLVSSLTLFLDRLFGPHSHLLASVHGFEMCRRP